MLKSKITRRLIDATPPQIKRVILHDTEVNGFQCRTSLGIGGVPGHFEFAL